MGRRDGTRWCAAVAGLALGLYSPGSPVEAVGIDACRLLADAEFRSVQSDRVAERKPSEKRSGGFRVVQCLYRAPDLVRSVSIAVTTPTQPEGTAARDYWRATFHPVAPNGGEETKKVAPPKAVPGLGEEAFWVGDRLTGALYVLQGNAFLRISVGGAAEEATRLKRSKTLTERALPRLRAMTP